MHGILEHRREFRRPLEQPASGEFVERGMRGGDTQRMGRVGVAVEELDQMLRAAHEGVVDRRRGQHTAEGHGSVVDGFGKSNQVRADTKEIGTEGGAEATEAGDHLVEDQQDAVPCADLTQSLQVALRRHDDPGGALHRLDDDGGDVARIVQRDDALEFLGEVRAPLGLTARVAHLGRLERVRQVIDARDHQRCEHLAVGRNAADRDAAHADAVVGPLAADDARP